MIFTPHGGRHPGPGLVGHATAAHQSLAVAKAGQVDQLDGGVVPGKVVQFVGEARAAEAVRPGCLGRGAACGEQSTDAPEAFQVAGPHDIVPFRLTDAEQRLTAVAVLAVGSDVDFVTGLGGGVVDRAAADPGDGSAVGVGRCVPAGGRAARTAHRASAR